MAFSRTNCPYPSDIPANGSANGSSPREKFLGTSENTRWKLRWVEEVGPQPESRAIANAKWLRDNFCLSSLSRPKQADQDPKKGSSTADRASQSCQECLRVNTKS